MITKKFEDLITDKLMDFLMRVDDHRKDKSIDTHFDFYFGTEDKLEPDDLPITHRGTVEIKTNEKGRLVYMMIEVDVDYE
jgi:hypothetical protein